MKRLDILPIATLNLQCGWTCCESVFLYDRFTVSKYWPGHRKHLVFPVAIAVLPPSAHLGKIAEGKRVTAADRKQEDDDDGLLRRGWDGGGANKQVVRVLFWLRSKVLPRSIRALSTAPWTSNSRAKQSFIISIAESHNSIVFASSASPI